MARTGKSAAETPRVGHEADEDVDWRRHIGADPRVLVGKPVVKGTRLSVEFILGLFAAGWTEQDVFENYPHLTPGALRAVFAFAAECLQDQTHNSLTR